MVLFFLLSILIPILYSIFFFKKDLYIKTYKFENEIFFIKYQKKTNESKLDRISIPANAIKSVKFASKSFFDRFYIIKIKYVDAQGLYNLKTFKTNSAKTFALINYNLQKSTN